MIRPYFNFSGKELIELFEKGRNDFNLLKDLQAELKHRKTQKMLDLEEKVSAALKSISGAQTSTSKSDKERELIPAVDDQYDDPTETWSKDGDLFGGNNEDKSDEELAEVTSTLVGQMGSIRACGKLVDVPSRWNAPEKDDLKLDIPEGASRPIRYGITLRALIREMQRKGSGMRTVSLEHGKSIVLDGRDRGYTFNYDGDADLFEGAKVLLSIGNRTVDGRIVSVSSMTLTLTVMDDLGPSINSCTLKIDNTSMIEALVDQLEKVSKGEARFNSKMADDAIGNIGDEEAVRQIQCSELNAKQEEAVQRILSSPVTYLWGPPGTGKTKSLSNAIQLIFEEGKRILISSNTNQAVDQVLLKLCETLGKNHPAMEDGKILRLGHIHHAELANEWTQWISLDGIVGRKSIDLKNRKNELERNIELIQKGLERAEKLMGSFKLLDATVQEHSELLKSKVALEKALNKSLVVIEEQKSSLSKLEKELEGFDSAGFMRRLVLRKREDIDAESKKLQRLIEDRQKDILNQKTRLYDNDEQLKVLQKSIDSQRYLLSTVNRESIQRELDVAEEKISPLNKEISEINRKLEEIEKTIVKESKIIGATVTKTYLSAQLFDNFDVVIIDEASMVMLPAVYYVSGLASEKVVISGDFRQLSPIVPSEQKSILSEIGGDIFRAAGIEAAFNSDEALKRTVMLEHQYRMKSSICDLISPRMYNNRLKTADAFTFDPCMIPAPFDSDLVIVDTSPIQPFVNKHGTSRYNLMHALTARNICRHLSESGYINSRKRVGVCTPFAAQKDVLTRILKASNLDTMIDSGTVHRYQGDEKDTMIIDVPDSLGEYYVGMFAQAEHPDEDGSKMFNVAVSRARQNIIFIANLDYLDRRLPERAFLREILHTVQTEGRIVDVRDVLAMWPIQEELRSFGRPFDLDAETLRSGLFRQADFDTVCLADLEKAKKSIAIFSGFITPQRVGSYETLFRRKRAEGVAIRCVTRPPKRNGSIPEQMGQEALDGLESIGCIVDTRWNIHEKVVIIDDEIVWFGSLNPLSHTHRTDEMMARFSGRSAALQLAAFMAIGTGVNPEKADGLSVKSENPRCPDCKSRSVYRTGSYGPFWQCEKECGWRDSVSRSKVTTPGTPSSTAPKKGPSCPICKSETSLRRGRFGEFYGCIKYPSCEGIVKLKTGLPAKDKSKTKRKVSTSKAKNSK